MRFISSIAFFFIVSFAPEIVFAQKVEIDGFKKIYNGFGGFKAENDAKFLGGTGATAIGDLDGNGISELAVTGKSKGLSLVYILFLDQNNNVKKQNIIGENLGGLTGDIVSPFTGFAEDICPLGDLNDDGIPDIAVSDQSKKSVYILFMTSSGKVKSFRRIAEGRNGLGAELSDESRFGSSLCLHDDLDADGNNEIVVGDAEKSGELGALYLLFLNDDGTVKKHRKVQKSTSWQVHEEVGSNAFAVSSTRINDLNNDGISELLVTATIDRYGNEPSNSIYLIYHDKDFKVDSVSKFYPELDNLKSVLSLYPTLGVEIDNIGDVDGNGFDEIAISAHRDSSLGKQTGSCIILFTHEFFEVDSVLEITGGSRGFTSDLDDYSGLGRTICAPGDLNGDGTLDIVVSAPADSSGGFESGALFLVYLTGKKYVTTPSPNTLEASIYPNPASNTFQINTKEQVEIRVLNVCGQVVWQGKAKGQQTIDASQWQAGMYFVLISEANHDLSTQKLIIQH